VGYYAKPRHVQREFWRLTALGLSTELAAAGAGVPRTIGQRWFRKAGGMAPLSLAEPSGRFLSFAEREEIALGRARGLGVRAIAGLIGRSPSTVSRELRGGTSAYESTRGGYRASVAAGRAQIRARRPKVAKLAGDRQLAARVQAGLRLRWSPRQISVRFRLRYPDQPEMWVSHETIYQSLYVQGRGALRRELAVCLRTGRAIRKPRGRTHTPPRQQIKDMVLISERPAEVADRAVPGHWEGDLIIGKKSGSAIGTLVERTTRYCLLLHLPGGRGAPAVRDAMLAAIATLPGQLWRSLTWDQGIEMKRHREITDLTGLEIYFCDPRSPWQRGSNENTNGLLRQYFSQRHRPVRARRPPPGLGRRTAQRPPTRNPRLADPHRSPPRTTLRTRPCCNDHLNPP
jgi:transposase, IS30 family